jgi:hypothetical protein
MRLFHATIAALLLAPTVALAQDRDPLTDGDAPPPTESPTGRTEEPRGSSSTGRRPIGPLKDETSSSSSDDKPGLLEWPWRGTIRSPEWTQDRSYFPLTRFWLLDAGRVELDATESILVSRFHSNQITHNLSGEIHVGLVPHLALGVTENFRVTPGADLEQDGNRLELRFSPFDYGLIPLNPTFMFVYNPKHGEGVKDRIELRLLLGGELIPRFQIVGNGFWSQETGGKKNAEWGFTVAAGFELVKEALRVGGELRMQWEYQLGMTEPFHVYDLQMGPSIYMRPLAFLNAKWSRHLKLEATCLFGVNRRTDVVDAECLVGYEF